MKLFMLVLATATLCMSGCCTTHERARTGEHAMTKWEYKTVVDNDASAENLSRLGQEGWHVVSFNPYAGTDGDRHVICLLQRPTQ